MIAEIFSYENVIHVLLTLLVLAGLVALILVIRLLSYGRKTLDRTNDTVKDAQTAIEEVRGKAVKVLDKADVAVDAVNADLLRLDMVLGSVEEVSTKALSTVGVARELVQKPSNLLNSVTEKLRWRFKERRAASLERAHVARAPEHPALEGVNVAPAEEAQEREQ
ncbi:MAG: hypothetical protein FWC48_00465 [Actinomycetia bacterium]|nr:hypothetical protein [Actinomycetes bacterium]